MTVRRACWSVFALLTLLSWVKSWTFHAGVSDLGIFHQVLWNTARLRPFQTSLKHMSYLGDHFSPGLVLLAPLEWLPFPVEALLMAQAGAVAYTAFCMYRLAQRHLDERTATVIGLATLLHPALYAPALFDLHPELFMAAALALGLLELDRGRLLRAALCFLLFLLGKEDSALALAPLGLVLASQRSTRWFGLGLCALSLLWMGTAMFVLMPLFRPPPPPSDAAPWFYLLRYAHLGRSASEIAGFVLRHPFAAVWRSFTWLKLATALVLVLGFAGAPLYGGRRLLAALPLAGAHYLSARWTQFFFTFQYLVVLVPLFAWAAIAGAPRTFGRWPRACAAVALGVGVLFGVLPRLYPPEYLPRTEHSALRRAVRLVPDDAAACATDRFGASLAGRRAFDYCVPFSVEAPQYAFYQWPKSSPATYQLFDLNGADYAPDAPARAASLRAAGAQVLLDEQNVVVLRVTPQVLERASEGAR